MSSPKNPTIIFQPSIFRWTTLVSRGVYLPTYWQWWISKQLVVCLPEKVTFDSQLTWEAWDLVFVEDFFVHRWGTVWWFSQGWKIQQPFGKMLEFLLFFFSPHGNVDFPTFLEPNAKVVILATWHGSAIISLRIPSSLVRCMLPMKRAWLSANDSKFTTTNSLVIKMPAVILDTWNLLKKPLFWLEFGPSLVGFFRSTKTGTNRL